VIPGTVFLDREFVLHDGKKGPKYFVVFNDNQEGVFVAARLTSKPHGRGIRFGCQPKDRFPNFHLPLNSCAFLREPTWICLNEYFELAQGDLFAHMFSGRMVRVGEIERSISAALLKCAAESHDVSKYQQQLILGSIARS
jgi:hypothetical protein